MKKWKWAVLTLITICSLGVELNIHHDPAHHHWWSSIPAFWIYFGLFGCIVLIFFAKLIGKLLLNKKEDYYDVK